MKKFISILCVAIVAMSCVFAANWGTFNVGGSFGYTARTVEASNVFDNSASVDVSCLWNLDTTSFEVSDTLKADVYVSAGYFTDFKSSHNGDVYFGAGFTETIGNNFTTSFIFGLDTTFGTKFALGPGLYIDGNYKFSDKLGCFVGTRFTGLVNTKEVLVKVNAGVTYTI